MTLGLRHIHSHFPNYFKAVPYLLGSGFPDAKERYRRLQGKDSVRIWVIETSYTSVKSHVTFTFPKCNILFVSSVGHRYASFAVKFCMVVDITYIQLRAKFQVRRRRNEHRSTGFVGHRFHTKCVETKMYARVRRLY